MDLLVLANAKKLGGKCVAGLEVLQAEPLVLGDWIRPVTDAEHGQFDPRQTVLSGESREVALLDIVSMRVGASADHPVQPENRAAGSGPWGLVRRVDLTRESDYRALLNKCESARHILGGPDPSLPFGARVGRSLELREVLLAEWRTGGTQIRCSLRSRTSNGHDYDLPVTDPEWMGKVRRRGIGRWRNEEIVPGAGTVLITFSLGEAFAPPGWSSAHHWKLVAGVIPVPSQRG